MTIPHVPSNPEGIAHAAEQNLLIDQCNTTATNLGTRGSFNPAYVEIGRLWEGLGTWNGKAAHARLDALEEAPPAHTHAISEVTGLQATLDTKASTSTTTELDERVAALEEAPAPALALGDLANVTTTGATVGQVLKLAADGVTWAPGTDNTGGGNGGGATTLDELADVTTTGATTGQVLTYSGGTWSPAAPAPAAHTHLISDVTGLQSALDGKAATSSVNDITGRMAALESAAATLYPTTASDTMLYGDVISSHQRSDCQWGESLTNNYMTAVATRSPKSFTATELRLCVTAAAAGSGTFDLKVYTGSSLSTLSERHWAYGQDKVNTAGVKHIPIGDLAITEGQYVAICMIVTGWTTPPRLSSTPAGTGAQLLIGEQPYSVYQGGQTFPPPNALNMTDAKWTRANQLFWFALA